MYKPVFSITCFESQCTQKIKNYGTNVISGVILGTKMQIQIPAQENSDTAFAGKGQMRAVTNWTSDTCDYLTLFFLPEEQFMHLSLLEAKSCLNPHI